MLEALLLREVVMLRLRLFAVCSLVGLLAACQTTGGTPSSPGFDRLANETGGECRVRLYPNYDGGDLDQCVSACNSCYTTSGGSKCVSWCKANGAR